MRIVNRITHRIQDAYRRRYEEQVKKIKNSNWYHGLFPHLYEFEKLKKNSDILCIGSSPAKYSFDFKDETNVQAYNLAILPETIYYDFQVVKNYHSFLKPGGLIVLVLCPFTFLKDKYTAENGNTLYQNIRYYPILHRAMIDNYDYKIFHKYVENPLLLGIDAWKRLIRDTPKSTAYNAATNTMSVQQMEASADKRVNGWKKEFGLIDLNPQNIPDNINNAIDGNIRIYHDMVSFIRERGYKCVAVVPPFSKELTERLPNDFINYTLFRPLKEINIPYISYLGLEKWMGKELYKDCFLMNAFGRKELTHDLLLRIHETL